MKPPVFTHILILTAFMLNSFGPLPRAQADDFRLPAPGVMVRLSPPLAPPILKGIKIHPDNPFRFDFVLDKGDSQLSNDVLKDESSILIKYFLASLTIPEQDLWVNLSPYEKDRIIPQSFGLTEMGRDLLAEDYMLKQITASLIYPEDEIGKKFWNRIYEEAVKKFGTTNIPVNTFNKVWIVPEKAVVYENSKAGTAYVVEAKLKVMLEEDYLSMQKHVYVGGAGKGQDTGINRLGSQIVREIVIPELTREVNEDKNFVKLRQVYNSLILAAWYKKKIKDSILEQIYADKNKTAGVQYTSTVIPAKAGIQFKNDVEGLYKEYLKAFKKGVYNYIKEEQDPVTQEPIPRKYFSGGMDLAMNATNLGATKLQIVNAITPAQLNEDNLEEVSGRFNVAPQSRIIEKDQAMTAKVERLLGAVERSSDKDARLLVYLNGIRSNVRQSKSEEDRYYCELTYRLILYLVSADPTVIDEDLNNIPGGEAFSKGEGGELNRSILDGILSVGDVEAESLLNNIDGTWWVYARDNLKKVLKIGDNSPLTGDRAMQAFESHSPDLNLKLEISRQLEKQGLPPGLVDRILQVEKFLFERDALPSGVTWSGRSLIIPLSEQEQFTVHGRTFKVIRLKGTTDNGHKPKAQQYIPSGNEAIQPSMYEMSIQIQDGRQIVSYQPSEPEPQGAMPLHFAVKEYESTASIFDAGVPVALPIGYGEFTDIKFNGKQVGFTILAEENNPPLPRVGTVFRKRVTGKKLDSYYEDLGKYVLSAVKLLGRLHRAGFTHTNPHLDQFGYQEGSDGMIYDFETAYDARHVNSRDEFIYRVLSDFRSFYRSVDQVVRLFQPEILTTDQVSRVGPARTVYKNILDGYFSQEELKETKKEDRTPLKMMYIFSEFSSVQETRGKALEDVIKKFAEQNSVAAQLVQVAGRAWDSARSAGDQAMSAEDRSLMDDKAVQHFFETTSQINQGLFPIYVSYTHPGKVLYFDRFPMTQIQEFWKDGRIQAFESKKRYILFIWGPGKRDEWARETGQPIKQEMLVPPNKPVRIRFIDIVEIFIGRDRYKVWVDEEKNIKMQHVEDLIGMRKEEPVSIPWEQEQRSIIKKGSLKISKGNKGEYRMDYWLSSGESNLRWESRPTSAFDYEGVHATGNTGKYDDNFGSVDTVKGTLILTSGARTLAGMVAKTMQSSLSGKEFSKSSHNEIQSFLEEVAGQGVQDINNYRTQHPRAAKAGVSVSLGVIIKDTKERGLLVGVNAGNTLFLRRVDKRTDLLSNKGEAGALGVKNAASEIKLGYFIRSVTPGDMVVAVSPGILDTKIIEQIIAQNDDPQEIRRQLMEKAKAATDSLGKTNNMTVAVLKVSSEIGDSAPSAIQQGPTDQAMNSGGTGTLEDQQRSAALKEFLRNLNDFHDVPVEVGPYTDKEGPPFGKIDPDIQAAIGNGEFFEVHFKNINRAIPRFRDPRIFNLNRAIMALSVLMENSIKKEFPQWRNMHPSLTMVELFKNALFHGNSLNVDLPLFVRINKRGIDVVDFGLGDPKNPWPDAISGPALIAGFGQGIQYARSFGWDSYFQPLTPLTVSLDDQTLRSNVRSSIEYKVKMQEFTEAGLKQMGTVIHIEPIQKILADQQGSTDQAMAAGEKLNYYMNEILKIGENGDYTRVVSRMIGDPDLSVPDHEKGRFRDVRAAGEVYSRTSAFRVFYAAQWDMAVKRADSLKRRAQLARDKRVGHALNDLAQMLGDRPAIIRNKTNAKWAIIYEVSRNNGLNTGQRRDFIEAVKAAYRDRAMTVDNSFNAGNPTGGIDLTPANMDLQTQNNNGEIKFHLDPALLEQLRNAPGFVPVIVNIQPMNDLRKFLGINEAQGLIGV
jgi:hypothetical protein